MRTIHFHSVCFALTLHFYALTLYLPHPVIFLSLSLPLVDFGVILLTSRTLPSSVFFPLSPFPLFPIPLFSFSSCAIIQMMILSPSLPHSHLMCLCVTVSLSLSLDIFRSNDNYNFPPTSISVPLSSHTLHSQSLFLSIHNQSLTFFSLFLSSLFSIYDKTFFFSFLNIIINKQFILNEPLFLSFHPYFPSS